jgi:hypothetical protein
MLPVKAQRRKALPRFQGFLCAFAPLREKSFSAECDLSSFVLNLFEARCRYYERG